MGSASVTGGSDDSLTVATPSPEAFEQFLMQRLLRSGLVREIQTHFVLRPVKTRSPWPLLSG